jgi:hypothetical protein
MEFFMGYPFFFAVKLLQPVWALAAHVARAMAATNAICMTFIDFNRDFPFGFLPTTSVGLFRNFLPYTPIFRFSQVKN